MISEENDALVPNCIVKHIRDSQNSKQDGIKSGIQTR